MSKSIIIIAALVVLASSQNLQVLPACVWNGTWYQNDESSSCQLSNPVNVIQYPNGTVTINSTYNSECSSLSNMSFFAWGTPNNAEWISNLTICSGGNCESGHDAQLYPDDWELDINSETYQSLIPWKGTFYLEDPVNYDYCAPAWFNSTYLPNGTIVINGTYANNYECNLEGWAGVSFQIFGYCSGGSISDAIFISGTNVSTMYYISLDTGTWGRRLYINEFYSWNNPYFVIPNPQNWIGNWQSYWSSGCQAIGPVVSKMLPTGQVVITGTWNSECGATLSNKTFRYTGFPYGNYINGTLNIPGAAPMNNQSIVLDTYYDELYINGIEFSYKGYTYMNWYGYWNLTGTPNASTCQTVGPVYTWNNGEYVSINGTFNNASNCPVNGTFLIKGTVTLNNLESVLNGELFAGGNTYPGKYNFSIYNNNTLMFNNWWYSNALPYAGSWYLQYGNGFDCQPASPLTVVQNSSGVNISGTFPNNMICRAQGLAGQVLQAWGQPYGGNFEAYVSNWEQLSQNGNGEQFEINSEFNVEVFPNGSMSLGGAWASNTPIPVPQYSWYGVWNVSNPNTGKCQPQNLATTTFSQGQVTFSGTFAASSACQSINLDGYDFTITGYTSGVNGTVFSGPICFSPSNCQNNNVQLQIYMNQTLVINGLGTGPVWFTPALSWNQTWVAQPLNSFNFSECLLANPVISTQLGNGSVFIAGRYNNDVNCYAAGIANTPFYIFGYPWGNQFEGQLCLPGGCETANAELNLDTWGGWYVTMRIGNIRFTNTYTPVQSPFWYGYWTPISGGAGCMPSGNILTFQTPDGIVNVTGTYGSGCSNAESGKMFYIYGTPAGTWFNGEACLEGGSCSSLFTTNVQIYPNSTLRIGQTWYKNALNWNGEWLISNQTLNSTNSSFCLPTKPINSMQLRNGTVMINGTFSNSTACINQGMANANISFVGNPYGDGFNEGYTCTNSIGCVPGVPNIELYPNNTMLIDILWFNMISSSNNSSAGIIGVCLGMLSALYLALFA